MGEGGEGRLRVVPRPDEEALLLQLPLPLEASTEGHVPRLAERVRLGKRRAE